MTADARAALDAVWRPARRSGVLGSESVENLRRHSAGFAAAAQTRFGNGFDGIGLDLGTGAGVPGVFVADALPSWRWVLVDASARRCAFAQSAAAALQLQERVTVLHCRADEVPCSQLGGPFDAVTARLFGPPAETVEVGLSLAATDGMLITSVRSVDRGWWETLPQRMPGVESAEVAVHADAPYAVVVRGSCWDRTLPRRPAARRRRPLA